ncbi:MAG TPA: S1/P1 nuclease [Saprospiraceae bacterium]|nr:S1/P1 nuclease [Saprospiraceae bacterium]
MKLKRIFQYLGVILLIVLHANSVFAYSKTGHQIISQIAMQYLDPVVRENVIKYLNGTSIEESGIWMDEMRSNHEYDYMKPWHYINIERGDEYESGKTENIISELEKTIQELGDKQNLSNEQVKTDLLILFHLIGDLHQPLHVGYGADRGGNTLQVNFVGHNSNLHKVWDDEIIQNQNITLASCLQFGTTLSDSILSSIKQYNLINWMEESRAILKEVYNFEGHQIDETYAANMKPVIEKELVYAGIRLASILETYFNTSSFKLEPVLLKDTIEISPKDAIIHIGEIVKVCGLVYGGKAFAKITLINMGAAYPDSPFSIAIFDKNIFKYKPEEYLNEKTICVTGLLKLYNGKAEIVVSDERQIVLK